MTFEINNITKKFGKKIVLDGITVTASSGDCIGILGVNGSGKSTLFNIISGVSLSDGGSVFFDNIDLLKDKKKRRDIIGYVTQNPPLIEELTAYDNMLLWYNKKDMLYELENGVLKMLGIDAFLKVRVSKMSGGMKKRLAIGCAVANKPKILLLDEPTGALDLVCKECINKYLSDFKNNGGIIIIATHDVQDLPLCNKMYILKNGKNTEYNFDGDVEKLTGNLS